MNKFIGNVRTVIVLVACGTLVSLVSSCTTAEPVTPPAYTQRPTAQIVGSRPVNASAVSQKRDTGTYPTFAPPLTAAGTQMTDEEAASMQAGLSRHGSAPRKGQMSEAEYKRKVAELRALGEHQGPGAPPAPSQ